MSKGSIYRLFYSWLILTLLLVGGIWSPARAQGDPNSPDITLSPSGRVVSGASEYRKFCAQCHGPEGKGDGPVASELKTPPADLTQLAKKNGGTFPYQSVFDTISGKNMIKSHGTRDMPMWSLELAMPRHGGGGTIRKSTYQVNQEIKRITDYIKSIQQQ